MIGVLASGNGSNLQALIDADLPISVVIANRPDAYALERGEKAGIEAILIDHCDYTPRARFDEAIAAALVARKVSWVVLAGFMRIVKAPLLEAFAGRIVNVHPALLPAYPGLHAQKQALEAGAKITGCTIHLVDAGVDTGPILAQAALVVRPDDDESSLSQRILRLEHALYPAVMHALISGQLVQTPSGRPTIAGGVDVALPPGAIG